MHKRMKMNLKKTAAVLLCAACMVSGTTCFPAAEETLIGLGKRAEDSKVLTEDAEKQTGDTAEKAGDTTEKAGDTAQDSAGAAAQENAGKETPVKTPYSNGKKVAVDPGHQGSWVDMSAQEPIAPGASETKAKATTGTQGSFSGLCEYELNLGVSLLLREELEKRGYDVVLTRDNNDAAISNMERARLAAEKGADILVRIHANGSDDPSVHGALTRVPSKENPYVGDMAEECYKLGEAVLNAFCAATGFENLSVGYYDNMSGINWSTIPVTILEMGFMSNQSDDTMMADESFWPVMAAGIADGIDDYFGLEHDAAEKASRTSAGEAKTENTQSPLWNEMEDHLYVTMSGDAGKSEEWSVAVCDPEKDEQILIHNAQMQAASLIKLYIMGAVYRDYDAMTEKYGQDRIESLLHSMIIVSDNSAANTLTSYLGGGDDAAGRAVVNDFCEKEGYKDSVMGRMLLAPADNGDNYTSVGDCMEFLKKVYNNSYEYSEKMLEHLKGQERKHKIPRGLPEGVASASKTGELGNVENDVAIVFAERPYILCVMSGNLSDAGRAQNLITKISSEVYKMWNAASAG